MIRVVKVGGSLFQWPQLPRALREWLAQQSPAVNVLLAGGGELANFIRQADRDFSLGDARSHWLCIDAMSVTANILAAIMADFRSVSDFSELKSEPGAPLGSGFVFNPREFLRDLEPHLPGPQLPHDWTVTSDSITARLAQLLVVKDLVLMKSADPPAASLAELAEHGYVDRYFPTAAAGLSPRFVNLRSRAF